MNLTLKTPIAIIVSVFYSFYNCDLFPDGNYRVEYTFNSQESNLELKIKNGNFSQHWVNGDSASGKIIWIYQCLFKLEQLNIPQIDTIKKTEFESKIIKSFGEKCFELEERKGDTIFFRTTYTGNRYITLSKGIFILLHKK